MSQYEICQGRATNLFFLFSLLKGCFAMLNKIIVDALDSIICDGSYHFYSMSECCSGILGRKQNSANDYWILVSKIWNGNNLSFLSFFLLFFLFVSLLRACCFLFKQRVS